MLKFYLQSVNEKLSNTLIGTILLILTYLFFSVMELTAKELVFRFNPFLIVFARYLSQLILLLIIFNKQFKTHLNSRHIPLQI